MKNTRTRKSLKGATYFRMTHAEYRNLDIQSSIVLKTINGTYEGSVNSLNQRHGKGVMVYNWGDKYDGEFYHGEKRGTGVFLFKTNSFYSGKWRKGAYHGTGIYCDRHGNVSDAIWYDGRKEGIETYYYSDGRIEVNYIHADLPIGQGVRWSGKGEIAWSMMNGHVVKQIPSQKVIKLASTINLKVPIEIIDGQLSAMKTTNPCVKLFMAIYRRMPLPRKRMSQGRKKESH